MYQQHRFWTHQDFGDTLPSQVARDHFSFCFISDRAGVEQRDAIGVDKHHVGVRLPALRLDRGRTRPSRWPSSSPASTTTIVNKITHENAMRIYRYDPFAHRPRERRRSPRCGPRCATEGYPAPAAVAQPGHQARARQRAQRPLLGHVEHDRLAGLPPDDEAHHAVVARRRVLHHAVGAVDLPRSVGVLIGHGRSITRGWDTGRGEGAARVLPGRPLPHGRVGLQHLEGRGVRAEAHCGEAARLAGVRLGGHAAVERQLHADSRADERATGHPTGDDVAAATG